MSSLTVQNIQGSASSSNTINVASGHVLYAPGHVLQMLFTQYTSTTTVSISADTSTAIDVLSVNITPKSTSSIIRIDAHIFHEWADSTAPYDSVWFFYRDSTKLAHPQVGTTLCGITNTAISYSTDGSSTPEVAHYSYFDAPSTTNQITYKVGAITNAGTTIHINKSVNDTTTNDYERGISFISVTEIAQ